jgi:hypothetical protein
VAMSHWFTLRYPSVGNDYWVVANGRRTAGAPAC